MQIVDVSDNVTQLTRVAWLELDCNSLVTIPDGVLAMTQLTYMHVSRHPGASTPC